MIFNERSNYMLKYEKAKAKLIEFEVNKENYPNFAMDSDDLTYTTIFALSRYCEEKIDHPNSLGQLELFNDLNVVSQYYDATVKSKRRQQYDGLFLLLGATAYFLADNYGSAKVLISRIENWSAEGDLATVLYSTLYFLLLGADADIHLEKEHKHYYDALCEHFFSGGDKDAVVLAANRLRDLAAKAENIYDVTYADFLFCVTLCAIEHSAWILLPKCSSNNRKQWREYLSSPESIKLLWPAQKVIFEAGVLSGKDYIVPLPTGVGKTKSIELIIRSKFMTAGTQIALVIAPLRALCHEITMDLSAAFGNSAVINQITDTPQEDFKFELLHDTKYIIICTPEKFSYILRHYPELLAEIQLFIFDEAHLFDDSTRGAQYELLMSEIARGKADGAQMVLFSAVLSNSNQISEWLFKDKNCAIDHSLVKSTEKSIGFLSSDQTIHYYEKDRMAEESFFVPKSIRVTQLQRRPRERKERIFPENTPQDIALYFAAKLCKQEGVAIFAGQVRSIAPIMRRIVEISARGYDLHKLIEYGDLGQIEKLSKLFQQHYGSNSELTLAAKLGAFSHYANLPNGVKMSVEYALRKGHIHFVVCTTTLAEGVNIPIRYLILTTFSQGNSKIQIRKMQNLIGRTARSGIHTEGSAIIADTKYYDNRQSKQNGGFYRWTECKEMFEADSAEACTSAILSLVSDLKVDYQISFPANDISQFIIDHYGEKECFSMLSEALTKDFSKVMPARVKAILDQKVSSLQKTIESIENYLCFVYDSLNGSPQFIETTNELAKSTFAFYLADDQQKKYLENIFSVVAKRIVEEVDATRSSYFAKSLYGIDKDTIILNWVDSNLSALIDYNEDQLLRVIVDLFLMLSLEQIGISEEAFRFVLAEWLEGKSYCDIFDELNGKVSLNQIEKMCSGTISYSLCFLLGNIVDAIGERNNLLRERLSILQKRIKYGVPNLFQILVCENIVDDRLFAELLDRELDETEMFSTERSLRTLMKLNRQKVLSFLDDYPDYFTYRFKAFLR